MRDGHELYETRAGTVIARGMSVYYPLGRYITGKRLEYQVYGENTYIPCRYGPWNKL